MSNGGGGWVDSAAARLRAPAWPSGWRPEDSRTARASGAEPTAAVITPDATCGFCVSAQGSTHRIVSNRD